MMRSALRRAWLVSGAALMGLTTPSVAQNDSVHSSSTNRVADLERQVKVLWERERVRDSATRARPAPTITAGADGFTVRSADGDWRVRVGGYIQADTRVYPGDEASLATTGLILRRARPIVEGTISRYFDFRVMPDFGTGQPTVYEAYLEGRIRPELAIRAGKFKPPIGLERLQSATDLRFVERGFPTNLAPNRDVGIQVGGDLAGGIVGYVVGIFNGVPDLGFGDVDVSDPKDLVGRLFLRPFARRGGNSVDLGFGLAASSGHEEGTLSTPATSNLRTPGQLVFFRYRTGNTAATAVLADGRRTRLAPQAYIFGGRFGLLAEYTHNRHTVRLDSTVGRFPHQGGQVAASAFLTGERASYRSVTPRKPFDPGAGTWGALELAVRFQWTGVDEAIFPVFADPAVSAQDATAWAVGLNWHLAKNLKLMFDVERASFTGGAANGNRPSETFVVTRFQTAF